MNTYMRALEEYVLEEMEMQTINTGASTTCCKLHQILATINRKNPIWKAICDELTWSEIPCEAVREVGANEMKAQIYKRSGFEEYVLWLCENDELCGRSIGLRLIENCTGVSTIKGLVKKCPGIHCVVIDNYEQYSTVALRNKRREMKMAANTLKDIRNNIETVGGGYFSQLSTSYRNLHLDTITKLENITNCLIEHLKNARENETFLSLFNIWQSELSMIESRYNDIVKDYANTPRAELDKFIADVESFFTKYDLN